MDRHAKKRTTPYRQPLFGKLGPDASRRAGAFLFFLPEDRSRFYPDERPGSASLVCKPPRRGLWPIAGGAVKPLAGSAAREEERLAWIMALPGGGLIDVFGDFCFRPDRAGE